MALGERIVAELGATRTNNTLARWLAHHTARLVHNADAARAAGAPDADELSAQAVEAILRLWQVRTSWPSGWPPPRAAEIARLLDGLPMLEDDPGRWHRPSSTLGLLQDIHLRVLSLLVDIAAEGDVDTEIGWLEAFGESLTAQETTILHRVADHAARRRRVDELDRLLRRLGGNAEVEAGDVRAHPLLELADAYTSSVVELVRRISDVDDLADETESG